MQRAQRNAQSICNKCDRPFYSKGLCKRCYMALYRSQLTKPKTERVTNRGYSQNGTPKDFNVEDFWLFVKQELKIG